ncbi:2',5'-phosphodiesterase 12 [Contarinia nasturtii]|uniref:2',5'-phosphodiesterase 12 n=1 Tax=Contarinia nasturtii TaxID=265458 RepID=UPI0012D42DE0|nr:2',5'-phosphodiesterase 12 [Contarinia nasturtii]
MLRWNRIVNMGVAHIRRSTADAARFELVFRYQNPVVGIDRVFNLQRDVNESIRSTLTRIKTNVEKEHGKKLKKRKKPKKGEAESETTPHSNPVEIELLMDKCETTTWSEIFANVDEHEFKESKLKVCDQEFTVAYNYPYVQELTMPSTILVGFDCYPAIFKVEFTEREKCLFEWYRGKPSPNENSPITDWDKCEEDGFFYRVKVSDLNHKLKFVCTPKCNDKIGPTVELISNCVVEAGPGCDAFENKQKFTPTRLEGTKFRVVSYNLLADYYADSDFSRTELFPYCPPFALAIDYRKHLFIREIRGYNADICCLQEVDSKIFDLDLKLCLGNDGLEGILQKKGTTQEGVATFYNRNKFDLVQSLGFNLSDDLSTKPYFNELYEKIKNNEKLCERMVSLSTALQVTVLKSKANGQILIVANTHLYFHPDADHIRLLQIGFFMLYVKHVYERIIAEQSLNENQVSVIFCGDFNSVPECGIYKLMTEKFVPDDFIDFQSNAEQAVTGVSLQQPFDIRSAYNNPKYTNFTVGFAACLDYIFYQTNNLTMLQAVPLPSDEELTSLTAIPSILFPSDHVSLVADFDFINHEDAKI